MKPNPLHSGRQGVPQRFTFWRSSASVVADEASAAAMVSCSDNTSFRILSTEAASLSTSALSFAASCAASSCALDAAALSRPRSPCSLVASSFALAISSFSVSLFRSSVSSFLPSLSLTVAHLLLSRFSSRSRLDFSETADVFSCRIHNALRCCLEAKERP